VFGVGSVPMQRAVGAQAHLQRLNVLPDTYCQKWWCGLCIHVLPFESIYDFIEQFLKRALVTPTSAALHPLLLLLLRIAERRECAGCEQKVNRFC
jgi:hypothetical protein